MLDQDTLKGIFGDLSPEDLDLLRKELVGEEKPVETPVPPPPPPPMDPQKVADAVVARMPQPEPPPAPQTPFDMKSFQEKFLNDPMAGLDYVYQSKMGYSPSQVIPVMAAALAQTRQDLEAMKAQSFRSQAGNVPDEDWQKVTEFQKAKGLDWQDAYDLAKVRGIIKAQEPAAPPPRLPRGGGKVEPDENAFLGQINDLSDEKLEALFMKSGGVSKPHLT